MVKKDFKSAEIIATDEGLQYHIGLKPGDVAPNILMCGDPARAYRVAEYFEDKCEPITNREYVTITGNYKKLPITVMATGMGPDNTEIAVVELSQIVKNPTFIRIGTSGTFKKSMGIGDMVIATGSVRLENTSTSFVVEGYPAVANHEVVLALIEAARKKGCKYHVGLAATASGFYGVQGRTVPGFSPRDPDIPAKLETMNVCNFEMESSCLFTLAQISGARAGMICVAIANRHFNTFIDNDAKDATEKQCIEIGLDAFHILKKIDAAKGKEKYWVPSMGL